MNKRTFVIAEIGVNHNNDMELAVELIKKAKEAGADAAKFQTFKANRLVTKKADKADYQKLFTPQDESHFEMIENLELSEQDHSYLIESCENNGIEFMSSAFDIESHNFLVSLGLNRLKIPSGEITNLPLLQAIGKENKKTILSTGMSNLEEIYESVSVLKDSGLEEENLTILHCNTEYPTPMEDVNLNAMLTIKKEFSLEVGYSDHTTGIEVPIAATALGASVIEKHFTTDRNLPGPDHSASLLPEEFKEMVSSIRNINNALGSGEKVPSMSELKNLNIARKSIVALRDIEINERFSEDNIGTKRPGNGISPMLFHKVIGKKAKKNFLKDEQIEI